MAMAKVYHLLFTFLLYYFDVVCRFCFILFTYSLQSFHMFVQCAYTACHCIYQNVLCYCMFKWLSLMNKDKPPTATPRREVQANLQRWRFHQVVSTLRWTLSSRSTIFAMEPFDWMSTNNLQTAYITFLH